VIDRLRLLVLLTRPSVVVLVVLFVGAGAAEGGARGGPFALVPALVAVVAFLVSSVALNDLSDEAIDRLNRPDGGARPLLAGGARRQEMAAVSALSALLAVAASAVVAPAAAAVVVGGLVLSASYSLRPVRLADRGAVASLLLPAGYVAVPYLVGLLAARDGVRGRDLLLLAALYLGFIGRIILKDFRDVRGDTLFGKRTFLVRHGRRRTCAVSAASWVSGTAVLATVRGLDAGLVVADLALVGGALVLLRALSVDGGARRDERLISAIALVGRGLIVALIGHLSMTDAGWSPAASRVVLGALAVVVLGQARTMARHGAVATLTVPPSWTRPRVVTLDPVDGPATGGPSPSWVRHLEPTG
jgi:4-hydroxybenzoate polyprenyltransferase